MTVTVTPTVEPNTTPPRVRLNIVDTGGLGFINATRLDPDGRTRLVRTFDGNPSVTSAGVVLLYDYEAPFGAPVTYSSLESPATISAPVTVNETRVWLVHPGVPSLSMPIDLHADSFQEEEWAVTQGVHWPLGREFPVVQTDGQRKAAASSMTVAIASDTELRSLKSLLFDAGTVLLNIPGSLGYGLDTCYIAVGAVRNKRLSDIGSDAHRAVVLPYQVVDRPAGGSQALRTYVDVLVDNASYASVMTKYSNYQALLAGP